MLFSNSSIPACPAPEAAWYVELMKRFILYFLCSGCNGKDMMAVVQLGFATRFASKAFSPFTSGTTNGIFSVYRKAELLSSFRTLMN